MNIFAFSLLLTFILFFVPAVAFPKAVVDSLFYNLQNIISMKNIADILLYLFHIFI
jgi:hypothetical protein